MSKKVAPKHKITIKIGGYDLNSELTTHIFESLILIFLTMLVTIRSTNLLV